MSERKDVVWKSAELVEKYLENVRGAIPLLTEQVEVMCRVIGARMEPVRNFLDLGCGDGFLGAVLLNRHPHARGVFVDFSEPMIEAARKNLIGWEEESHFKVLDYSKASWTSQVSPLGPFDAIVSGFSIHHQPDERKRQLYGELFELLCPGGIFINIEHVASPTRWVERLFEERMIDGLYNFEIEKGGKRTREDLAEAYYHRDDKEANVLSATETQCEWLRELGYQDVDCFFKLFELAVFGGRRP